MAENKKKKIEEEGAVLARVSKFRTGAVATSVRGAGMLSLRAELPCRFPVQLVHTKCLVQMQKPLQRPPPPLGGGGGHTLMPAGLFTQYCSAFISHAHLHCSVDVAFHQLSDIRWRRMALPKELCQTHGEDVRAGVVIHSSSIPPLKARARQTGGCTFSNHKLHNLTMICALVTIIHAHRSTQRKQAVCTNSPNAMMVCMHTERPTGTRKHPIPLDVSSF